MEASSVRRCSGKKDSWFGRLVKSGDFLVKSIYCVLKMHGGVPYSSKEMGGLLVSFKIVFFFLMRGCIGKDPNLRLALNKRVVFWKGGRNGQFRVKEAYNLLANPNDTAFPTSCIWVNRVPTKVAFFAWEATWGKVLILDRLQKRG